MLRPGPNSTSTESMIARWETRRKRSIERERTPILT
jgi:hypothetical protein